MRYRCGLLIALTFACTLIAGAPAKAQWHDYQKWEVAPFVGYETPASYPVASSVNTVDRLRADAGASFGTFVDYSLTDNSQAELMWARNYTTFQAHDLTTNTYSKAFDSAYDQFQLGFLFMFRNSERKLRPFIAGSIGATHEANSGGSATQPDRTMFAFGLGGGAKYDVSKHFSLRGDLRYLPSRASSTPGVVCDAFGNCFQQNISHYLNRVNLTVGFAFKF
jgi:opacity protein-like surface antigen